MIAMQLPKMRCLVIVISILSSQNLVSGMLVKDWGTDNHVKRLAWAVRDFFDQVTDIITIGQLNSYPIAGFSNEFYLKNLNNAYDQVKVGFVAYNGWLEGLKLNGTATLEPGKLRRLIVTKSLEKNTSHFKMKDGTHHHEIISCDNCLSIVSQGLHFGFEAHLERPKQYSWGTLKHIGPIGFLLSFQLTVMTELNVTTGRTECQSKLEEVKITKDPRHWITADGFKEKNLHSSTFPFLSDEIFAWVKQHFETTVTDHLQLKVQGFSRTLQKSRNMCNEFLTSGPFVHVYNTNCHV